VIYDTGNVFSGRGWKVNSRPKLTAATAHRETSHLTLKTWYSAPDSRVRRLSTLTL
jgi:hypothetical protein